MGLFDILGDIVELPFRAAQIPTKIIKAVDEATVDSGVGEIADEVNEATMGDDGSALNEEISELDD